VRFPARLLAGFQLGVGLLCAENAAKLLVVAQDCEVGIPLGMIAHRGVAEKPRQSRFLERSERIDEIRLDQARPFFILFALVHSKRRGGPLRASVVDELLKLSGGTLARVLLSQ